MIKKGISIRVARGSGKNKVNDAFDQDKNG